MPNIFFAEEELKFAKEAINLFAKDNEFLPTSKHWSDFLIHLDLCFIKAERGCQDIKNSFQPFQGYYKKQRKDDPLLSYLKNARDAVVHDIQSIVSWDVNEEKTIDTGISMWRLDEEGNKEEEIELTFHPFKIKLQPFYMNNKTWVPPKFHLDRLLLCDREPMEVAFLGIKFYEDFLTEIKRKFYRQSSLG